MFAARPNWRRGWCRSRRCRCWSRWSRSRRRCWSRWSRWRRRRGRRWGRGRCPTTLHPNICAVYELLPIAAVVLGRHATVRYPPAPLESALLALQIGGDAVAEFVALVATALRRQIKAFWMEF